MLITVSVDGGWTGILSVEYSATCGTVTETTIRTCTNPVPRNGGKDCVGEANETSLVVKPDCPGTQRQLFSFYWLTRHMIDQKKAIT